MLTMMNDTQVDFYNKRDGNVSDIAVNCRALIERLELK